MRKFHFAVRKTQLRFSLCGESIKSEPKSRNFRSGKLCKKANRISFTAQFNNEYSRNWFEFFYTNNTACVGAAVFCHNRSEKACQCKQASIASRALHGSPCSQQF